MGNVGIEKAEPDKRLKHGIRGQLSTPWHYARTVPGSFLESWSHWGSLGKGFMAKATEIG
jgi:hypothetical protein